MNGSSIHSDVVVSASGGSCGTLYPAGRRSLSIVSGASLLGGNLFGSVPSSIPHSHPCPGDPSAPRHPPGGPPDGVMDREAHGRPPRRAQPPGLSRQTFFLGCACTGEQQANSIANRPAATRNEKTNLVRATRDEEGAGEDFCIIWCGTVGENPDSRIPGRN